MPFTLPYSSAKDLHLDLFKEEYDFMLDSHVDAQERSAGKNPMSEAYQQTVQAKRQRLGVPPLRADGMAADSSAMDLCTAEIAAQQRGETTPNTARVLEELERLKQGG